MASSREEGGPRHAGRVVDPLARDDGVDEPELLLEPTRADLPDDLEAGVLRAPDGEASQRPELNEEVTARVPRTPAAGSGGSHPVRDRLLARAVEARAGATFEAEQESSGNGAPSARAAALDRIGGTRGPAVAAGEPARRRHLSANVVALFGTLFGLATVASLFAVLVHLDPREGGEVAAPPAAKTTPAPSSEQTTEPPRPKKVRKKVPGPWRIEDDKLATHKTITGMIGREPFLRAIQKAGVPKRQAYRAFTALKDLRNLDKCGRTDGFAALLDKQTNELLAFEYIVNKEEVYQARENERGLLTGRKLDLAVERERVRGAIMVTAGSFSEAAEAAGFEPGLARIVDEALDGHASVDQFRKGDRLRVVAQEITVLGDFSRYAGVEALEYLPVASDKPIRIYYYRGEKELGYFDRNGRAPYEGGWRKPIKGAPITSKFNPKRMHPVLNKVMPHNGTDFGAPTGTPVGSTAPGKVTFIGYSGASGNLVQVDHGRGYESGYAHLSRFERGLKVGDRVGRLQVVGYVGSTGRSTGPHLHFSMKKNGKFIDAESLQLDGLRVLPKSERGRLAVVIEKYDRLLDAVQLPEPITAPAIAPDLVVDAPPAAAPEPAAEAAQEPAPVAEAPVADPTPAAVVPAPRPAAPPGPAATAAPAPAGGQAYSALYITDRELMQMQSAVDDGEVEE